MSKRAFITGVTGQDGSYLTELLLRKGYNVHGATRSVTSPQSTRLLSRVGYSENLRLHECDLTSLQQVTTLCQDIEPDEIYNLASQSHVGESFRSPFETLSANATVPLVLLETVRALDKAGKEVRVYHASTSDMFGSPDSSPQTEQTRFHPRSPYACSKVFAFHQMVNYREAHGLFVCNGILYNHESPRRPEQYVTRRITKAAARIAAGLQDELTLGNLDVGRDWGYAKEYVVAMWKMLQQPKPSDYIIATNEWHTLEDFLERAFQRVNVDWRSHVKVDPALMRPTEVTRLQGNFAKAKAELGWEPVTKFDALVDLMVDADLALLQKDLA